MIECSALDFSSHLKIEALGVGADTRVTEAGFALGTPVWKAALCYYVLTYDN